MMNRIARTLLLVMIGLMLSGCAVFSVNPAGPENDGWPYPGWER